MQGPVRACRQRVPVLRYPVDSRAATDTPNVASNANATPAAAPNTGTNATSDAVDETFNTIADTAATDAPSTDTV